LLFQFSLDLLFKMFLNNVILSTSDQNLAYLFNLKFIIAFSWFILFWLPDI